MHGGFPGKDDWWWISGDGRTFRNGRISRFGRPMVGQFTAGDVLLWAIGNGGKLTYNPAEQLAWRLVFAGAEHEVGHQDDLYPTRAPNPVIERFGAALFARRVAQTRTCISCGRYRQ